MNFFFDRQISLHIARMIDQFDRENTIVAQDDDGRFIHNDTDVHIISTLASDNPKPIWITADLAQKRDPIERSALRDSGMTLFFFKGFYKNRQPHFQALKVLSIWPILCERASKAKVPTAFEVPYGRVGKLSEKISRLGATTEVFKIA